VPIGLSIILFDAVAGLNGPAAARPDRDHRGSRLRWIADATAPSRA